MEYKIVFYTQMNDTREEALKKLEEMVNEYLKVGWRIAGGVSADRGTYYQALYYDSNK